PVELPTVTVLRQRSGNPLSGRFRKVGKQLSEPFCLNSVSAQESSRFAGVWIESDILVNSPAQLLLEQEISIISLRQWEWTYRIVDNVASLQSLFKRRVLFGSWFRFGRGAVSSRHIEASFVPVPACLAPCR